VSQGFVELFLKIVQSGCFRGITYDRVAVAGRQWYQSIDEIRAVILVPGTILQSVYSVVKKSVKVESGIMEKLFSHRLAVLGRVERRLGQQKVVVLGLAAAAVAV
jgi:hypothetical protein